MSCLRGSDLSRIASCRVRGTRCLSAGGDSNTNLSNFNRADQPTSKTQTSRLTSDAMCKGKGKDKEPGS